MEAFPHGRGGPRALGAVHHGQRRCGAPHPEPWWIVDAVDKKRARLNCISHLLTQIPYQEVQRPPVVLPARVRNPDYHRGPVSKEMYVPAVSERASGATPAHIADIGDAHATLIPPLVATLAIY